MNSMDSVLSEKDKKQKALRQFIVRRRRSVDILLTDGVHYWIENIPGSEVEKPYTTHTIDLSNSNKKIILVYVDRSGDYPKLIRTFNLDKKGKNYKLEPMNDS